jgi:hypothetical protein
VSIAGVEAESAAQRRRGVAVDDLQPTGCFEACVQDGREGGAVTEVGVAGALPGPQADQEPGSWEHQLEVPVLPPWSEQAARVVEVEVREHHHVHLCRIHPGLFQRAQQHVLLFHHPETIAELRLEEHADACLQQDGLAGIADQEAPAGEGNAIGLVRSDPPRPEGPRCVAEHGAAVEALAVSGDGGEGAHHHRSLPQQQCIR